MNDWVYVQRGNYMHRSQASGGTGESFPLSSNARGVSIVGLLRNGIGPTISAYYHDGIMFQSYSGWPSTGGNQYMFVAREGWYFRNLTIENLGYQKASGAAAQVCGIGIVDLGRTAIGLSNLAPVTISNCILDDNFVGIAAVDTQPEGNYFSGREVEVTACVIKNHGPILGSGNDKGHQGIWLVTWPSLTVTVGGTEFDNNHDAIESGNADPKYTTIVVDSCNIHSGENGLELSAGTISVANTTFERNEAVGASNGGVNGPSIAFGLRGTGAPVGVSATYNADIRIRDSVFHWNQLSFKLSDLDVIQADLGTTSDPGGNLFELNPTTPWVAPFVDYATPFNTSYVNIWQVNDMVDITAVGNYWTYRSSGACLTQYNQDVCVNTSNPSDPINGTFACFTSKVFSDPSGTGGFNIDASNGNKPNRRVIPAATTETTCDVGQNYPYSFAISDDARDIIVK